MKYKKTPLYSFDEARELDFKSIEKGFSELQLMGQAALASLYRLKQSSIKEKIRKGGIIHILAGSGNNGGDGLALAYHLASWDSFLFHEKSIHIYKSGPSRTATASHYENLLAGLGFSTRSLEDFIKTNLCENDTVIEGLLGTGQKPGLKDIFLETLKHIAHQRRSKNSPFWISLDIPAGISESGSAYSEGGELFPCGPDEIHVYGTDKICLNVNPEICITSKKYILPMGFYPATGSHQIFRMEDISDFAELKKKDYFHKYRAGHGIAWGGSKSMEGAISLACESFFASGGGIINCIVPDASSKKFLLGLNRSVMFHMPEGFEQLKIPVAVAAGPGLSPADIESSSEIFFSFLKRTDKTSGLPWIILDASASELILDKKYPAFLLERTIITPHSGEWVRMGGNKITCTDDIKTQMKFAESLGCNILIKDSVSVLFERSENRTTAHIRCRPHNSLAAAGSGDVLTGIILAVLSRKENADKPLSHLISAALALHEKSARKRLHPSAQDFPELIRKTISHNEEMNK